MAAKKVSKDKLKKSAAKNKNRTKVWVDVTNQPEKSKKGGTYIGMATFHWADDAEKNGHSQNISLPGPFKLKVTGKDLMVTPKGEESYKFSNKQSKEELDAEKGEEEEVDEEETEETEEEPAVDEEEEEDPPKKKKKPAKKPPPPEPEEPAPKEEEEADEEELQLRAEELALKKRRERIALRKEIEAEERDLARRQEALAAKKKKHEAVQSAVSQKVEEEVATSSPEKVGTKLGESLFRMSKNSAVSVAKVTHFLLSSLSSKTREAVKPFLTKALENARAAANKSGDKKHPILSPAAAQQSLRGLRSLGPRPAALMAGVTTSFASLDRIQQLVKASALEATTTSDQTQFLSEGNVHDVGLALSLAASFEEAVAQTLWAANSLLQPELMNNDGAFAIYCELTGQGDGIATLSDIMSVEQLRALLPQLQDAATDLDSAIDLAGVAYTSAMYEELAIDLNMAVTEAVERPLALLTVAVPSESFNGNAFDALALLRSSTVGSPMVLRHCAEWVSNERAGVVRG